jgi:hypothetical protein
LEEDREEDDATGLFDITIDIPESKVYLSNSAVAVSAVL